MSWVTGVTVITHCLGEVEAPLILEAVNKRLLDEFPCCLLKEISDHAGGSKHPQTEIWAGGFNAFGEDARNWFVALLEEVLPEDEYCGHPKFVAVFHGEEHDWRINISGQAAIYTSPNP